MNRLFAVVRLASIAIAAVALVLLLRGSGPPPDDAVRQTFAEYKRAVAANDGTAAAALLSDGTVDWYRTMQDLALHATKDEVQQLGPLEKIQVLAFRQRVPLDTLRALTPRQLVAYSVDHGWIGKAGTAKSELGAISASNDSAVATLLFDGKDSQQEYHFVREGGRWVFDQLPTLHSSDEGLKAVAAQRGMTLDQFVQFLLESASGKRITEELWQPPLPRATAGATS